MNSGGFTEDDQTRIAEEVLGRVGSKRTGLGFSGEDAIPTQAKASSSSSGWFEQHAQSASREVFVGAETHDTTKGPFAWDGGQRDLAKSAAQKKDKGRSSSTAPPREVDGDRPTERVFPMVRDRDIEMIQGGRDRKSRERSRSPGRSRDRRWERAGRSDSRSRSRERREAERRRERQRERERERQREGERERQSQRERHRERSRRNRRSQSPNTSRKSREEYRDRDRIKETDKVQGSLPTAEQAKAAVKRQLRKAVIRDETLKTGAKSTGGGGASWERPEMSMASDFFNRDEISSKGGVASVAPEYEARLAEILAIEDEDTMCLDQKVQPTAAGFDPSTQKHHDAIFAPTGSAVSEPVASVPAKVLTTTRIRSGGVAGAAARARALLSGKLGQEGTASLESAVTASPELASKASANRIEQRKQPRDDDNEQALFKTLRAGESVEAQWTVNDNWYSALVVQSIHSGFEIARYKVRYSEYGNEETISWRRIRRLKATEVPAPPCKSVEMEMETAQEDETPEPANETSLPFAGMRPRALCVENDGPTEVNQKDKEPAEVADVVNPALRSGTSGRKLSWKEKLAARTSKGADPEDKKKEISLVPDFAAQRREQEVDRGMDKDVWRTRVAFGMGNSKKSRDKHTGM